MTFDLDAFRLSVANDPIIRDVWEQKYRFENEASPQDTRKRVVDAILPGSNIAQHIIGNGYFCPAGRILAGAGTGRRVTMGNCWVGEVVQDNMPGIQRSITRAALTMQQGGGHGTCFSTIRPAGAVVKRTGSISSGMLPFADQQNAMCATIMSSGCLEGNTLVTTSDGFIPIREIVEQKLNVDVKTHEGWKAITHYFDNGEKDVVKITFENGRDIVCTKEHRFHTISPLGEVEKKPIGEMEVGDTCLFPTLAVSYPNYRINDDLSYVLGHYWANGCTQFRRDRVHLVRITFADTEIGVQARERCQDTLTGEGLKYSVYAHPSRGACTDIQMFGEFARFFVELAGEKGYSHDIEFPDNVSIIPFVAGYFDGDGSWRSTKKGPHFTSVSLPMLKRVQDHLLNLGIPSKLYAEERPRGWRTLHRVAISGPYWQSLFKLTFSPWLLKGANIPWRKGHNFVFPTQVFTNVRKRFPVEYKRASLERKFSVGQNISYHTFSEAFPESELLKFGGIRITRIEAAGKAHVYDLEVEDTHSYIANGISVSNSRRGAMMLTLHDSHPDLWNGEQFEATTNFTGDTILRNPSFISAKRQKGRLTNFNVSVLISDAFMQAVENGDDWDLGFHIPRADGNHVCVYDKPFPYDYYEIDNEYNEELAIKKGTPRPWYVYRRVPARRIWEDLMRSTYTYAEPGVIFIDRVNKLNNLGYTEEISATNPCGEQPLPASGVCNLGSINLAFLVKHPFTPEAHFDYNTYCAAIDTGVRFLDKVLDKMNYPLQAQYEESMLKRRIGLGITGLGDALLQLGITYGSPEALDFSDTLAATLKERSYLTSIDLGEELGSFKAFDLEQFGKSPNLTPDIRNYLYQKGAIRNGVINTIAPNGTISLYLGNLASGVEPVFSFAKTRRRVRQADGGFKEYDVVNYSQRMYEAMYPGEPLPEYFVGAMDITPEQHVDMQAVWQQHIDSSISKTCNVPTEMSYEDFKNVYWHAYKSGCKGCTTYRYDPEAGRGFVLAEESQLKEKETEDAPDETTYTGTVAPRPATLESRTYKIRWPSGGRNGYHNLYVTVSRDQSGVPMEVFITTKEAEHHEWVTALGRMITAILRRGGDVRFLPHELMEVHSAAGGGWIKGRFRPSVVAAIGGVIEEEFAQLGILTTESIPPAVEERYEGEPLLELEEKHDTGSPCPKCHAPTLVHEAGCSVCKTCGYSTCE